jgi:hypothetical protein
MGWIKASVDETCHVAWQVRMKKSHTYLHAIGEGEFGSCVTENMAKLRFDGGRCFTPWLPVLFPGHAVTVGNRSYNCVTAAGRAMLRGWIYLG